LKLKPPLVFFSASGFIRCLFLGGSFLFSLLLPSLLFLSFCFPILRLTGLLLTTILRVVSSLLATGIVVIEQPLTPIELEAQRFDPSRDGVRARTLFYERGQVDDHATGRDFDGAHITCVRVNQGACEQGIPQASYDVQSLGAQCDDLTIDHQVFLFLDQLPADAPQAKDLCQAFEHVVRADVTQICPSTEWSLCPPGDGYSLLGKRLRK
jgi:hypothetical protein